MSADLARAIVASLDDQALDELAALLAPRLAERLTRPETPARGWLDAKAAAAYLGLPSVHAIHKLTATRAIPFEQERPGAKCWFRPADLDAWRRGERT